MFIYYICTQYLVGAHFALITASIRRGMEVLSSLPKGTLHCVLFRGSLWERLQHDRLPEA